MKQARVDRVPRVSIYGVFPAIVMWLLLLTTLPLRAEVLYWGGGTTDIADDTPLPTSTNLLTGTWNAMLKNWATSVSPGSYTSFINGSSAQLGLLDTTNASARAQITLDNDVTITELVGIANPVSGSGQGFYLTGGAAPARTVTLSGSTAPISLFSLGDRQSVIDDNVFLSGSGDLLVNGQHILQLNSVSTNLTGNLLLRAGTFLVNSNASVEGMASYNLRGGLYAPAASMGGIGGGTLMLPSLQVVASPTSAVSAISKLNDNAVIELSYGSLDYRARQVNPVGSRETVRKIKLNPQGFFVQNLSAQTTAGANRGQLILSDATAGLDRGDNSRGTLTVNVLNTSEAPLSDVIVSNGVVTDTLLPWIATTRSEFMRVNGTTKALERIPSTQAPTDLTSWVAGSDYRLGSNTMWFATGSITNNLSINSLGFLSTGTSIVSIADGKTLTIASGGIAWHTAGHVSFRGGTLTSGTNQLYFHHSIGSATFYVNVESEIAGSGMELIKAGQGTLILTGSVNNTYSGATYVNSGFIRVDKTASALAIPGNLVIENGGGVILTAGTLLGPTSAMTIDDGGLYHQSSTNGIAAHGGVLTINGGTYNMGAATANVLATAPGTGVVFNGGMFTYSGSGAASAFRLFTDVAYASTATKQARWQRLSALTSLFSIQLEGPRTFAVADSATLPAGTPEMVVDAALGGTTGQLIKAGSGVLQLIDTNSYSGGTVVNEGTLQVSAVNSPARSGMRASAFVGGQQRLVVTFLEPVATNFVPRQTIGSAAGATIFPANATISRVLNAYQVVAGQAVALGNVTDMYVNAYSSTGTLGTGPVTINGGTLLVDAGITIKNTNTLDGGTFMLNGTYDGALTWNSGTLAGTGVVVQAVTANGAVAPGASIGTLTFQSTLDFGASGSLDIEIATNGNDVAAVTGAATLGGTLNVALLGGYNPPVGSVFTVLVASAVNNAFAATNLPSLSGKAWTVDYSSGTGVRLGVVAGATGPTVGPVTLTRVSGQPLHVPAGNLMTNSFNPGGGALTCVWVSASSSNGHPVSLSGTWVLYNPPAGSNATDQFNFRLANTNGAQAESTATVLVISPETNSMTISSVVATNGGMQFRWAGIPGRTNLVEGATELGPLPPANWSNLDSVVIGPLGYAIYFETNPPSPRYYRILEQWP